MKKFDKTGFTIIETMLFLAVSGMFVAGILIATGSSINTQRYRDSVSSLQSKLQQQYSDVSNTSREASTSSCSVVGGTPVVKPGTINVAIGKSDCVILGKYITTDDGINLRIRSIIGATLSSSYTSDINALVDSNIIATDALGVDNYTLEWGATLKTISGGDSHFSILILRSPASGIIRTFIDPNAAVLKDIDIQGLINSGSSNSLTACVNHDGLTGSDKTAIYLAPDSTGASGVETKGDATSGC